MKMRRFHVRDLRHEPTNMYSGSPEFQSEIFTTFLKYTKLKFHIWAKV